MLDSVRSCRYIARSDHHRLVDKIHIEVTPDAQSMTIAAHQPSFEGYRPLLEDASKYITCKYIRRHPSSEFPPRPTPNSINFADHFFPCKSTNWSAISSCVDHQRSRNLHSQNSMPDILEWNRRPNRFKGLPKLLEGGCTRTFR